MKLYKEITLCVGDDMMIILRPEPGGDSVMFTIKSVDGAEEAEVYLDPQEVRELCETLQDFSDLIVKSKR